MKVRRTKESTYIDQSAIQPSHLSVVKIGLVATASALIGGFAAAWYYRDTLKKLQNSGKLENIHKSELSYVDELGFGLDQFDQSEPGTLAERSWE